MTRTIAIIENNILATNTIRFKLTESLMQKGFKVYVLTTGNDADLERARSKGISVLDVGSSSGNPVGIIRYIKSLEKALRSVQPDVCLTFTIRPTIWGNYVSQKHEIPVISNITGTGPLFSSNSIAYKIARILYKSSLRKTEKVFFQNADDMQAFVSHDFVKPEKAERIPGSGIDHVHFHPLHKESETRTAFLFIGRLVKDKGIFEYVQAAEILKREMPQVECRVLGPLWTQNFKANTITRQELDKWIKDGIIIYEGETSDVRPFIAAANCIVLPSYREGTSNVLLEAASMEKPGITCDVTGCREIVEDTVTGYLCKPANVSDLVEKMRTMATNSPERQREMGSLARQKVIREFDKQIVIRAYLNAIQSIVDAKR